MIERVTRRVWLERTLLLAGGATAGASGVWVFAPLLRSVGGRSNNRGEEGKESPVGSRVTRPSVALSLAALQARARRARAAGAPLPTDVVQLAGMNRIDGVVIAETDIILLGRREASAPFIHVDDLMVAIRSAYETDNIYRAAAPGCSIDPRDGQKDPWGVQDVRVLGMPNCRMSRRHVDLDYELKFVGSGLRKLDGVPDTFSADDDEDPYCGTARGPALNVRNRYWFAPRYPDVKERFESDDRVVLIKHPIEVQVLTEQQMRQAGVNGASPEAEAFTQALTRLLAAGTRREYIELRNDYRVIEVGRILRVKSAPDALLGYLLHEHRHETIFVPELVVGVKRTDRVTAVCGGNVEATPRSITATSNVRQIEKSYRGGVDAGVRVDPASFSTAPSRFDSLRQQVARARPTDDALAWELML